MNSQNSDSQNGPSYKQTTQGAKWFMFIVAVSVVVLLRRKVGLRIAKLSRVLGTGAFLLFLDAAYSGFWSAASSLPFSHAGFHSSFTGMHVLAYMVMAMGILQWHFRWQELKDGQLWHPDSLGISWLEWLRIPKEWVYRFAEPVAIILFGYFVSFLLPLLGTWLMIAGVCVHVTEQELYDRSLDRDLDVVAGLIEAEQGAAVAEAYAQGKARPSRSVAETQGMFVPPSFDLEKQIAERRQKAAARKRQEAAAGASAAGVAVMLALACLLPAPLQAQNAYITNNGDGTVSVIDTRVDKVTATVKACARPYGVAVPADGNTVFITCQGSMPHFYNSATNAALGLETGISPSVVILSAATNKVIASVPLNRQGVPYSVAATRDGSKAYVAIGNPHEPEGNEIAVIDAKAGKVTASLVVEVIDTNNGLKVGVDPREVALSFDGREAVAFASNGDLLIIDTAKDVISQTIHSDATETKPYMRPDGTAYCGDATPSIRGMATTRQGIFFANFSAPAMLFDTEANRVSTLYPHGGINGGLFSVAVSPDGARLAYGIGMEGVALVADMKTGRPIKAGGISPDGYSLLIGDATGGMSYSPDGKKLYIVGGGVVTVVDTAKNQVVSKITVGRWPVAEGQFIRPGTLRAGVIPKDDKPEGDVKGTASPARESCPVQALAPPPQGQRAQQAPASVVKAAVNPQAAPVAAPATAAAQLQATKPQAADAPATEITLPGGIKFTVPKWKRKKATSTAGSGGQGN